MVSKTNTITYENFSQAMQAIIRQEDIANARRALYKFLPEQRLYLAAHTLPANKISTEAQTLDELAKLSLFCAQGADNSTALLSYTDTQTLTAQCKDSFIVELSGADALNLVLMQHKFAALVVKSAQGWVGITKTDIRLLVKGYRMDNYPSQ
ncbi:hypothetical protein [Agitococcus lubricus]|uniref:Uncharacterized protein n=1 Tax=Agitococcus lubricus TaxID=1077255 RepID=A0A2T5IZ89_9GAMM|nr:hypothetical protein [Agitococcus lubricus]PTQ89281.1 hypothetical protein C8N29_1079 [Agitococcus lubricus]